MKPRVKATYKILNHVSNTFYIGSSTNLYRRWEQHKTDLNGKRHKNKQLQASWDKHGADAFVFIRLEVFANNEDMHKSETALINHHIKNPLCCNTALHALYPMLGKTHTEKTKALMSKKVQTALSEGRGGKFIPNEKTRQKMSESLKGNTCAKGYKRTDAEKEAIRQRTLGNKQWLGRNHNLTSIDKMGITAYAVDPEGNEIQYPSINAMREALGMAGLANILRAIKDGYPLANGDHAGWSFYTEKEDNRVQVPDEYKDLPRSRPEAKKKGAKIYFTGKPCKHGHVAPRILKGTCVTCRKIEGEKSNERKRQAKA